MVASDKQMGKSDLESFLNQQFPNSNKVNDLLEQIVASKNIVEQSLGDEKIPSFYSTISRYISQHTVNGISDWINANGQVNIAQVNRAAQTAKKVYEVQKRQEQEQAREKRGQELNEANDIKQENIDDKLAQIDFTNLSLDNVSYIARNITKFLNNENVPREAKQEMCTLIGNFMGLNKVCQIAMEVMYNPSVLQNPEIQEIISQYSLGEEFFDENGAKFDKITPFVTNIGETFSVIAELQKKDWTRENIEGILKQRGLDPDIYDINIDTILENLENGMLKDAVKQINEMSRERIAKGKNADFKSKVVENVKSSVEKQMQSQGVDKVDEIMKASSSITSKATKGITQDDMEDFFNGLFEGAIDLAQQAEEMGLPVQEGDGYTTFFEIEEGQQERGQDGIDGQEIGEVGEITRGQTDEVTEILQQGEDIAGEEVSQEGAKDTLEQMLGEEVPRQSVPDAMGIIGQLQNAAREEPNDYTNEDTYQSPTLDNLGDDKKGGILGFFTKIKEAVQARFAKKPEQKRLNTSSEQRIDENGWNITTYDGNGKDLMPRGTGFRNAMVRFAENTIGRIAKLTTNAPRSSEPINTPYVIPTNVQKRDDKQQMAIKEDKTNQWAVDPSRLAPLEHNTKEINKQVKGDGER